MRCADDVRTAQVACSVLQPPPTILFIFFLAFTIIVLERLEHYVEHRMRSMMLLPTILIAVFVFCL